MASLSSPDKFKKGRSADLKELRCVLNAYGIKDIKKIRKINPHTYKADCVDRSFAVKTFENTKAAWREYNIHKIMDENQALGVLVGFGHRFIFVYPWLHFPNANKNFKTLDEKKRILLCGNIGKILATMQNTFTKATTIKHDLSFLCRPEHANLSSFAFILEHQINKWFNQIEEKLSTHLLLIKSIKNVFMEKLSALTFPHPNTLIHADYILQNILINSELNIVKILDFEHAFWGDPQYDLAKITMLEMSPQPYQKTFIQSWSDTSHCSFDHEKHQFFQAVNFIALLQWRLKHFSISENEAADQLVNLMENGIYSQIAPRG